MDYDIEQLAAADAPDKATFGRIYERAFTPPPLGHDPATATVFTQLYEQALEHPNVIVCVARHRDGGLAGLCYGYPWHWSERTDAWSQDLRSRLDDSAIAHLEGAFAVVTLGVDPDHQGHGVGSTLLQSTLDTSACSRAWLLTEQVDSPALRLYRAGGWTELGFGPPAGDRPTLVLTHDTSTSNATNSR
ncbi:MAG: GNAT family N-acetyltransferase [Nitriliruptor sp.]|nr:MAG: GNAT family N-acetyltransferase [Nitriliruptor sp.]